METCILYFLIGFIVFEYLLGRWLDMLNLQHVQAVFPDEMKEYVDEEKYRKMHEYERAKTRLRLMSATVGTSLIVIFLTTGMLGRLYDFIANYVDSEYLRTLLYMGTLWGIQSMVSLPFGIYSTFVIEEEFGFNRYSVSLYVIDKIKAALLTLILGGGLISLILFLYLHTGNKFWILAWVVSASVMLFISMFYTSLIVPLFNKLSPLEDVGLRSQIEDYCRRVRFPLEKIMVIDGSRRSGKSNAYFSGIGPKKTIVLFDTLMGQHTIDELVAIVAHEVGHYKLKHTLKSYLIAFAHMAVVFYLLGLALDKPLFAKMLGASDASFAVNMTAFFLLYQPVSFLIRLLTGIFSRKFEYEADAYAKNTFSGEALARALKKLTATNLSNLKPHPLYVFFYYSHPPVLDRVKALLA